MTRSGSIVRRMVATAVEQGAWRVWPAQGQDLGEVHGRHPGELGVGDGGAWADTGRHAVTDSHWQAYD